MFKKEELNSCMLFKLRGEGLCVMLLKRYGIKKDYCFYNDSYLGKYSGLIDLDSYDNNLCFESNDFDIIAIKNFDSCSEVLHYVLTQTEPDSWDWIREEPKPEPKAISINLTINSKEDIRSLINELEKLI